MLETSALTHLIDFEPSENRLIRDFERASLIRHPTCPNHAPEIPTVTMPPPANSKRPGVAPVVPQPVVKTIRGGRKVDAPETVSAPAPAAPAAVLPPMPTPVNSLNQVQLALLRAIRREDDMAVHRAAHSGSDNGATGSTLFDDEGSGFSTPGGPSLAYLLKNTDWADVKVRSALLDGNRVGTFLLLWAATRGHDDLATTMLRCGVDSNLPVPWRQGDPANPTEAARLADMIEDAESAQLPVVLAAANNRVSTLKILLSAGANVNATVAQGWTALLRAAFYGYQDACQLLISRGASPHAVNSDGMTPLHGAIHGSHLKCAELLLSAGASYSVKDNYGMTPTLLARSEGSLPLFSLLWDAARARKDATIFKEVDPQTGRTPLHDLARLKAPLEMYDALLPSNPTTTPTPCPVTIPDRTGNSPLIYAALSGSQEMVTLMMRRGLPLFPHPTIDRALPTVVSLLCQLSRPSPLPDPAAKLRELEKIDSAASVQESRMPDLAAARRAADLRTGAGDALAALLSALAIVKESRTVVLTELDGVLKGMEAEVARVRAARGGLKSASQAEGKEVALQQIWERLQGKLAPAVALVGSEVSSGLLVRTAGEINELLKLRAQESAKQEKRARVQEDGVRKLGHAVKHASKWAREDLMRWDAGAKEVEKALEISSARQRTLLERCIGLADAAVRECTELLAALADAPEASRDALGDLQNMLDEAGKLGVWCRAKLRKLDKTGVGRTGSDGMSGFSDARLDRYQGGIPPAGRTIPLNGRSVLPGTNGGPVWTTAKVRNAEAAKPSVDPRTTVGDAKAEPPKKVQPIASSAESTRPVDANLAPSSNTASVSPPKEPQPPIEIVEVAVPSAAPTTGRWNLVSNVVSAVAGLMSSSAAPVSADSPPVVASPPEITAASRSPAPMSPSPELSVGTIGESSAKAVLPGKVRKPPPPPEKSALPVSAPWGNWDVDAPLPPPPPKDAPLSASQTLGMDTAPGPTIPVPVAAPVTQQRAASPPKIVSMPVAAPIEQQRAPSPPKMVPKPLSLPRPEQIPVSSAPRFSSPTNNGFPAVAAAPHFLPATNHGLPPDTRSATSLSSNDNNNNNNDLATALDRKVAALQAAMDAPGPSPTRSSPTAQRAGIGTGSSAGGRRKNNLASILDKYGM